MRLLVNKVCSYDLMISEHFAQVSDHPGLLDTSELLRPEAILKEKVPVDMLIWKLFDVSGSLQGLHKE